MIPPQIPYLLFPCGHNLCKNCLFRFPDKQNKLLNVDKCPMCRRKIDSYAINRSLMNLICSYTNNKHLLNEKVEEEIDGDNKMNEDIEKMRLRCNILDKEKTTLAQQYQILKK